MTGGLAFAEQWNFTRLPSRTGWGSTDRLTRGRSIKIKQIHPITELISAVKEGLEAKYDTTVSVQPQKETAKDTNMHNSHIQSSNFCSLYLHFPIFFSSFDPKCIFLCSCITYTIGLRQGFFVFFCFFLDNHTTPEQFVPSFSTQ